MNPEHEKIVTALALAITPVKVKTKYLLSIILIPIAIGVFGRRSSFDSSSSLWVMIGILAIIVLIALYFMVQRVDIYPNGLLFSGLFRKTIKLSWDEIDLVNFNRRYRWIAIRGKGRLVYFNSMDGLESAHDLGIIAAYRSNYKCPDNIKVEVESLLDNIDYNYLLDLIESEQKA